MTSRQHDRAREFVAADLEDALAQVQDAVTLLPETGLTGSTKLRAELDAAAKALTAAQQTFQKLTQVGEVR